MLDAVVWTLLIVLGLAVAFDYINGFHDTANAIATSVSTRALRPDHAIALSAVANFVGALIGTAVAATIGAGLIEPRPGPSEAPPALAGPLGLAWRMQRGTLLAWTVGLGLYGLLIGSAAKGVGDQLGDNAAIRDLVVRMGGSQSLELSFIGYAMSLLGVAGAAYAISAALRLHSEEDAQRTEPVLAGSVGRMRWAAGHIVFSLAGSIVAMSSDLGILSSTGRGFAESGLAGNGLPVAHASAVGRALSKPIAA